jgi:hypothetical protein
VDERDAAFHCSPVELTREVVVGGCDCHLAIDDSGPLAQLIGEDSKGHQICRIFRPGCHFDILGVQ